MLQNLVQTLVMSKPDSLARSFQRFGRWGFLLQIIAAVLILVLALFVSLYRPGPSGLAATLGFAEYIALVGFVALLFSAFLFYRYLHLSEKIADPETRPPKTAVVGILKRGLLASGVAAALSLLAMLAEVVRLLIALLSQTGQADSPVASDVEGGRPCISLTNVVGLLADQLILIVALIALGFTVWLLMRIFMMSGYDRKRKRAEA